MTSNINLASLEAYQGFNITGITNSNTGNSVSGVGDINGDGYSDIIIGARYASSSAGISYVIYGGYELSSNIDLINLTPSQGFSVTGIANSQSGYSVSGAGDVNKDGYDDIIIGTYGDNQVPAGAYVVYGNSFISSSINLVNLGIQGFSISGSSAVINSGYIVSGAGDVNNDTYADVIIGVYGANSALGEAYIIYGGPSLPTSIDLATIGTAGVSFTNSAAGYIGYSVASAGDINNDGIDDIIIGAPTTNSQVGVSYVVYGSATFSSSISLNDLGSQGFSVTGTNSGDYSGWSVSGTGDVNGDGYDDIIIGAPYASSYAGVSYIVYGGSSISSSISLANLGSQGFSITGANDGTSAGLGDDSGWSVAGAGDINGDGYSDIIIGAPNAASGAGISYIIFGSQSPINIDLSELGTQGFSIAGIADSASGWSVSNVNDINNDGMYDVIIGAPDISMSYVIYSEGVPTGNPTSGPTSQPTTPSNSPTSQPTNFPTTAPSLLPTSNPSNKPSNQPSSTPSTSPTNYPTNYPTSKPTMSPSSEPTNSPTNHPSNQPSSVPTEDPSVQPSSAPSINPSSLPSSIPSIYPSVTPTTYPSSKPTSVPSFVPTVSPSTEPSGQPSAQPFADPTSYPTTIPSSQPSRPYELVLNYNVQTAIYSTIASLAGGIILYLAPSFILKNWGYKYKYVYTEQEKESLHPHEIGLYKKEDQLFALHKEKDDVVEYLLEANPRDINDISLKLYQLIWEQLENNPEFKRNPSNSQYKYIYNDAEVNNLRENEIGIKAIGKLPLLSCDIFCNSEQLTAFKLIGGEIREFPIKITSHDNKGISKALFHSIAREYTELASSVLISFEENQIRDFLLIQEKMKPSISVFQKVFCLYTPVYKDLGNAPGFIHNVLNCNGHGPELLYRLITLDGYIPGFIYGICHTFLKKYQVGLNPRISDDSFSKIATYLDSHLESEIEVKTVNNIIHQEKKDDLERGKIGSDIDSSSFEQASSSADMFDRKKPTSTCIIQAVYEIEFNDPKINEVYQKGLGLSALKSLPFSNEETDVKQITQLGNSESYKSDKSSFNEPDMNYPSHIISAFLNARQVIEYMPIMKYVSQNIIYPLIENRLPESAKNISLPEILDSKTFLFTAHLGLGSIGAMILPQETITKGLIASTAASTAFGFRLAASDYLSEQKQLALSNHKPMDTFEITKYCVSTILAYTASSLATCALAKTVMPGYNCAELDLIIKLSLAGAECYSTYKTTHAAKTPTTADIVVPYVADGIAAVVAYTNSYGAMAIVASVITADWMSRLAMNMVHEEVKENYGMQIFDYVNKFYGYCADVIHIDQDM